MADDPTKLQKEADAIHQAIGECLMAWSMVEFHLQMMFREVVKVHAPMVHAMWSTPRAFEVRLSLLNAAIRNSELPNGFKEDWKLISNHIINRVGHRNQIAHGTLVLEEGKEYKIEPYLTLTADRPRISIKEIKSRADRFREIADLISYLNNHVLLPSPKLPGIPPWPEPRLAQELRTQAIRSRGGKTTPPESLEA